ncbi:MAG: DUF937 domain-containing protein [Deltaproteobacteria bacterium]|nr:DUF937 domain-containing protein [Deltaproteobacteria bacterium]
MSILDMLSQQLGGEAMRQIGKQLGTDEGTASKAVAGALPMIVSALAKNASKPEGADSLRRALEKDHDGSVLDNLGGLIGGSQNKMGEGILRHVLGGQRGQVESGLGKATGLSSGSTGQLLAMLAPMVMGALGKQQRSRGLDSTGLAEMLGGERRRVEKADPGVAGMLTSFLDSDGDGKISDEVAKMGVGLLGKMFSGR